MGRGRLGPHLDPKTGLDFQGSILAFLDRSGRVKRGHLFKAALQLLVKKNQIKITMEMCSKALIRALGKVFQNRQFVFTKSEKDCCKLTL